MLNFGKLVKPVQLLCSAILLILGLASLAGFCGQLHPIIEGFANFRGCYVIFFAVLTFMFLVLKRMRQAGAAVALLVVNAFTFVPFYTHDLAQGTDLAANPGVRVLELNVWGGKNSHWEKVVDMVGRYHPDIVGISETTPSWMVVLKKQLADYPYQIHEPRFGGVALLSRYPLSHPVVQYFGDRKRPRISADVILPHCVVRAIFVHPFIPIVHDAMRDKELAKVAEEAQQSKLPTIVLGDMNITPWCFHFDKLLTDGNLHDSERGFGFQPTWNAWIPPLFPIDHCLVSDGICVKNRQVLGYFGSDHLPLLVDLTVNARQVSSTQMPCGRNDTSRSEIAHPDRARVSLPEISRSLDSN